MLLLNYFKYCDLSLIILLNINHLFAHNKMISVRPPQRVSWYDTKQSEGEVPIMLGFWGMRSTPSLPSLPGPLCPRMVALDRALSLGQIELNCVLMLNWIDI